MTDIDGVILAAGRSSRMEGQDKAECLLNGRPMLSWVTEAARPQVRILAINRSSATPHPHPGLPIVPDLRDGFRGPLMGLYSAMTWFVAGHGSEWLALFACDTPFVPTDLVSRLYAAAQSALAPAAVVTLGGRVQPTASLWHCSLLPQLRVAVLDHHQAAFKPFLDRVGAATVAYDDSWTECFLNVNTPADLDRARALAAAYTRPADPC